MQGFWMTVFYEPLYNGLIFLVQAFPIHSVGIAVILLTLLVKIILFPLAQKSIKSQVEMKKIEPFIEKIKKDFPNNKEEQARKTMALYKEHKINPFSGCLVLLIQIPIIFALYKVFMNGIHSPEGVLYSFVHLPETFSTMFLGADLTGKSIGLAILAGASQFLQAHVASASLTPATDEKSFKNDFMKSMQFQMKYILPVFIAIVSYTLASAVALYWVTSNLFTVGQEYIIRKKAKQEMAQSPALAQK